MVFTLESSVRPARIGVYTLLGIKKQVPDIFPCQYDIRRILRATRTLNNGEAFLGEGILRSMFEKSQTLESPKSWIQSAIDTLRGRWWYSPWQ